MKEGTDLMISDFTQHEGNFKCTSNMAAAKQCQSETFFPFSFGQAVEVCGEDYLEQDLSGDLVVRKPLGGPG